ncbi:MAG: hypothetical protein R3C01_17485 [Planctomycetaceae bacterium]
MPSLTETELTGEIVAAALPSIAAFGQEHREERFVGLAVETLSEERYFHLSALFESDCKAASEVRSYTEMGYLLPEDIPSNCQEWPHFDFNGDCAAWKTRWAPTRDRLKALGDSADHLGPEERVARYERVTNMFWKASIAALQLIVESDEVRALPKGSCFVSFIYEHHDVF